MTKRKNILFALIVLLAFSGCFEFRIPEIPDRIVPPKFNAGPYQFYLTSMSVNFDTMLTYLGDDLSLDEYRETYPEDPSGETDWFVMRDTFSTEFDVDMSMKTEPVSSSIEKSMTFVEFSTRTFTFGPIAFEDVIDLSAVPEGAEIPVDSVSFPEDTSYVSFPMDRQRFESGELVITIQNDMVCTLGDPISVALYDSTTLDPIRDPANDPLVILWDTAIPSGGSSTESVSLAGVEFPKGIMVLINGVICGDEPDTLTNSPETRASSFSINGSINSLVGEYVQGDLDPEMISDTSYISFGDDLSDAEITVNKAYLDTTNIEITLSNTSNITGKIRLDIMSLDTSETAGLQYFSTDSMSIPSGGSITYPFKLNNSSIILDDDFEYHTYINIPPQYGELINTDEFSVSFDFYGKSDGDSIIVKSVDASFTQAEYSFDDVNINMGLSDMFPDEFEDIELSNIELSVDIGSDITIPMYVDLDLIGSKNGGTDTIQLSVYQQITGNNGNDHIVFTDATRLINFKPDDLIISGSILLDGSGNIPLEQTITVDGNVGVPMEFEITQPLSFSPEYSKMKLDELPSFLDDFTGTLEAIVNNTFQFGVDVIVSAARDTNYFNNAAYADSVRTLADITIPAMDTTRQELVLTKEDYEFIAGGADSTWIGMDIFLTGRNDGQPTTFLSTDSVTLRLNIQAEGTLDLSDMAADTTGGAE
ncbi:MAG: hypothetical protein U5N56_09520 [Candidatus Marinimicrobia bacterium]|nr:hypothetical protein [Candidatus Neomarinimicrobiota bacterium]